MQQFIQRFVADIGEGHRLRRYVYLAGGVLYVGCQIAYFATPIWSPLRGISLRLSTIMTMVYMVDLLIIQRGTRTWMWRMFKDNSTARMVILATAVLLITGEIGISLGDRRLAIWSVGGTIAICVVLVAYYIIGRHGKQIWAFILSLRRQ